MLLLALALALSLLAGALLGLLGGGGSLLMVPILRYVLGKDAHEAVVASLLVVGATSLLALVPHARAGRVKLSVGVPFGLAGLLGAYGASRLAPLLPGELLLVGLAVTMFATGTAMLKPRRAASAATAVRAPLLRFALQGLLVGSLAGLFGAGGGFLIVPALVVLGGLAMPEAIGTSLLVLSMNSAAGLAGALPGSHVDLKLAAALGALTIAGSVVGGRLAVRVEVACLRRAFGLFVLAMAGFVLGQELPAVLGFVASMPLALALGAGTALLGARAVQRPAETACNVLHSRRGPQISSQ